MQNAVCVNEYDQKPVTYSWPGGYPVFYVTERNNVLCPKCAATAHEHGEDDLVAAADTNWEDPDLYCDNCNQRVESAYADD